jgi:hypothetical protein
MQMHYLVINPIIENHAMLDGWKFGVNHIKMGLPFQLGATFFFCDLNFMWLV